MLLLSDERGHRGARDTQPSVTLKKRKIRNLKASHRERERRGRKKEGAGKEEKGPQSELLFLPPRQRTEEEERGEEESRGRYLCISRVSIVRA